MGKGSKRRTAPGTQKAYADAYAAIFKWGKSDVGDGEHSRRKAEQDAIDDGLDKIPPSFIKHK
jgi:hypothetical protein